MISLCTTNPESSKKFLRIALTLMLCSMLPACSTFSGGDDDQVVIEGERISILELEKQLVPENIADKENMYLPPAWQNEYWPQAGGYPNHAMHNLALKLNPEEPNLLWSTDIGQGTTKKVPLSASPVIFEDNIFTMDSAHHVSAFDKATGKELWRVDVQPEDEDEEVVGGGISVANGVVYVTSGYNLLHALDVKDGSELWASELPAPARSAPTVISGRAFVITANSRLIAISTKDGNILWEYQGVSEMTGLSGTASPAADSDIVVPAFSSGELYALRIENGSVAWSDNLSPVRRYSGMDDLVEIRGLPVIAREVVIAISYGGRMVAIDTRTGNRVWSRAIGGSQTPWISGDYVYVITSESEIAALSRLSGQVVWVKTLPAYRDAEDRKGPIIWHGPVMANDSLILASSEGEIRHYDPRNGGEQTLWQAKEEIALPPVIAGATLYLMSNNGKLLAYGTE